MNLLYCCELDKLKKFLVEYKPDYIVLEGYNAVGKGRLIEELSNTFNYRVYRPTYTGWVSRIPREYRWSVFSSFMDIITSTNLKLDLPILFDRGFFSGVVYNNDFSLAEYYSSIIKDYRVLHILVTCSEKDYKEFLRIRNSNKKLYYQDYLEYTSRYRKAFQRFGVDYIEYINKFENNPRYEETCAGCSHYTSYNNTCSNPSAIKNGISNVSSNRERCEYASEMEVQDGKLQSL